MGGFLPRTDAGLLLWAQSFSTQITAGAVSFGLTSGQATSYASAVSSYQSSLNTATNESTRTKGTIAAKDSQRSSLRALSQSYAALVQAHPGITPEQLEDLGLTVRDRIPTPVPPPAIAPLITIVSVIGRTVKYKITDANFPTTRRKPANAIGAAILSFAGTTPPPAGDPMWKLEGQTGKTIFDVQFSNDIAPGTACWAVALWYNRRGQYSPACEPVQTYLQIGPVAAAA